MLNIAYVFDDDVNRQLVKLSQSMSQVCRSEVCLGGNSIPHLTLAHIDAPESEAEKVFNLITLHGLPSTHNIIFGAHVIYPWLKERFYTAIRMENAHQYMKMQDIIMRSLPGYTLTSAAGYEYDPHVTLSCHLDKFKRDKVRSLVMPTKRAVGSLVVGSWDSYGRMKRIIKKG